MPSEQLHTESPHIIMSGATGLIGTALYRRLRPKGYRFTILSRNPAKATVLFPDAEGHLEWKSGGVSDWKHAIDGADVVINLAGKSLASGRWTSKFKQKLWESRINNTRDLVSAINSANTPPALLISSSAIGYYGNTGDTEVHENSNPGTDFLANLCKSWEDESRNVNNDRTRVVNIRTGLVLAANGGTLKKMLPAFKIGLGAWFGNGKQWFPWIHINDVCGIIQHAIENTSMKGAYNTTAPGIVTNKEFCKTLGKTLSRPVLMPIPGWILKLGLGGFADALLGGQRVSPSRTLDSGYVFEFPELDSALTDLCGIQLYKKR